MQVKLHFPQKLVGARDGRRNLDYFVSIWPKALHSDHRVEHPRVNIDIPSMLLKETTMHAISARTPTGPTFDHEPVSLKYEIRVGDPLYYLHRGYEELRESNKKLKDIIAGLISNRNQQPELPVNAEDLHAPGNSILYLPFSMSSTFACHQL